MVGRGGAGVPAPLPNVKRCSSDSPTRSGSMTRSEIVQQMLTPKKDGNGGAGNGGGQDSEGAQAESPARSLAAMLRSTLRKPGPVGASLREAFVQSALHPPSALLHPPSCSTSVYEMRSTHLQQTFEYGRASA